MSVITTTKPAIPKPEKPWRQTPAQRLITLGIFALAGAASYFIVAVTPVKGKLAYVAVFFYRFCHY